MRLRVAVWMQACKLLIGGASVLQALEWMLSLLLRPVGDCQQRHSQCTNTCLVVLPERNAPHAQATGKGQLYSGVADCLAKTVRAEGLPGLYKGWLPCWLRIGCVLAALLPLCAHQLRAAQHDA